MLLLLLRCQVPLEPPWRPTRAAEVRVMLPRPGVAATAAAAVAAAAGPAAACTAAMLKAAALDVRAAVRVAGAAARRWLATSQGGAMRVLRCSWRRRGVHAAVVPPHVLCCAGTTVAWQVTGQLLLLLLLLRRRWRHAHRSRGGALGTRGVLLSGCPSGWGADPTIEAMPVLLL